jgi:tetratricopeptide (TPR) repeat protein
MAKPPMAPVPPRAHQKSAQEPETLLCSLEQADPPDAVKLLEELEMLVQGGGKLPVRAMELLLPFLGQSSACAPTARLLGSLGQEKAIEPLRSALAHTDSLDVRLSLLAALAELGQSNFAIRTLRSMLLHGHRDMGPKIVETIASVGKPKDAKAIARLIRVAPDTLHLQLACIAYRLGEQSTYRVIVEKISELDAHSSAENVEAALRSVARLGSQRFASHVLEYGARETRAWFIARSRSIAGGLATHGKPEKSPDDLFSEAKERYFEGDHDACLLVLKMLSSLGVAEGDWKHLEASCLRELGRIEEAQHVCELGLAADNKHWQIHRLNGSLLWDLKEHHHALEAYDRALAIQPTDPYTWYYKGYALYCLENDLAALPCLDRAISLRKDAPYLYNQKAFCLERLGHLEEAILAYRKSVHLRPGNLVVRDYLGQALQSVGRREEALACFDQILAIDATHPDALYHRADTLYDMERWDDSEKGYEHYLQLKKDSYHAWFNRGLCNRFMRRFKAAVLCFEQALEIKPESEEAQKHLSYCLNPDSWLQDA